MHGMSCQAAGSWTFNEALANQRLLTMKIQVVASNSVKQEAAEPMAAVAIGLTIVRLALHIKQLRANLKYIKDEKARRRKQQQIDKKVAEKKKLIEKKKRMNRK